MLPPHEGATCATHPDTSARFICQRCGDFGCDACRVGDRCRICAARTKGAASAYAPLPAERVTRMLTAICVLLGLTVASIVVLVRSPPGSVAHLLALALAALAMLFVIPCGFLYARRAGANPIRGMRLALRNGAAAKVYAEGRYADAAAAWESICHDAVGYPQVHALAVQSLGAASLALGDVERARELMRAAARSGWFETFTVRMAQGPAILHGGLAIATRAMDDADAARHLDIARARCRRGRRGCSATPKPTARSATDTTTTSPKATRAASRRWRDRFAPFRRRR